MGVADVDGERLSELLAAWPLQGPRQVERVATGSGNLSYRVATPTQTYFLRIYRGPLQRERVLYEHDVLKHVAQCGLSFAVPFPVSTVHGSTLLELSSNGGQQLAALFPSIDGEHPKDSDLATCYAAGAALAELDQALSRISIPAPPGVFPPFGRLGEIHPAIPSTPELLEHIPLDSSQGSKISRIIAAVEGRVPSLYSTLPQQVVHRDLDATNVVIQEGRVVGVLDFEFVGLDLRALDLARSLTMFVASPWSDPAGMQWVSAFAEGYRQHVALAPEEIAALPDLMRLYRVVSLINREGLRRQGLASEADVMARALALLRCDAWLAGNSEQLKAVFS